MPDCATSPRCPAPTQTSQEKALLQVQELVRDSWCLPPQGWEPIWTPWCWHYHYSKLGSISRCPDFPDVVPSLLLSRDTPALGTVSDSFPPHGKWPGQAGESFWQRKSVDLQPSWHGSTLGACGQCDPSSPCPSCCLTHSGSFIGQS